MTIEIVNTISDAACDVPTFLLLQLAELMASGKLKVTSHLTLLAMFHTSCNCSLQLAELMATGKLKVTTSDSKLARPHCWQSL
jgi:hypothetical protein